jgi:hypothetical protein
MTATSRGDRVIIDDPHHYDPRYSWPDADADRMRDVFLSALGERAAGVEPVVIISRVCEPPSPAMTLHDFDALAGMAWPKSRGLLPPEREPVPPGRMTRQQRRWNERKGR